MSGSSGKLRVLLLTHSMTAGGSQRYLATLLEHLDRELFEPELAVMDTTMEFDIPADVPVWLAGDCGRIEPPVALEFPHGVAEERPGDVELIQRTTGEFAAPFDVGRFPFDTQSLQLQVAMRDIIAESGLVRRLAANHEENGNEGFVAAF